jgi:hypothetical protein
MQFPTVEQCDFDRQFLFDEYVAISHRYDLKRVSLKSIPSIKSIPTVVGSNPTVARHIFQACPVWIYTQSNITQASYSPEYIAPTQQIS